MFLQEYYIDVYKRQDQRVVRICLSEKGKDCIEEIHRSMDGMEELVYTIFLYVLICLLLIAGCWTNMVGGWLRRRRGRRSRTADEAEQAAQQDDPVQQQAAPQDDDDQ